MIQDAIRQARQMHQKVLEQTYGGTCKVYEKRSQKDPDTKVTKKEEVLLFENIPCHLSFSGSSSASGSDSVASVTQTIRLFLSSEIEIPPGSRIEVTQHGRTENYGKSGKASVYVSHQEIALELWEGYA